MNLGLGKYKGCVGRSSGLVVIGLVGSNYSDRIARREGEVDQRSQGRGRNDSGGSVGAHPVDVRDAISLVPMMANP